MADVRGPGHVQAEGTAAPPERSSFSIAAPSIALPKGGGAIRGIGEKFAANPVTGTGSMSVPIAISPGRSGFGPQLSVSYDSGAGNGPFGFGWGLSLPSITRKTDKGLPQYVDATDSDVFILSGAEDLVPVYSQNPDGSWVRDASGNLVVHEDPVDGYLVRRYRSRIEGLFARVERWSKIGPPGDVHWRSISRDNILTLYGQDENSRIAHPPGADPVDGTRVFSWLICESRDDKGNAIRYLYKAEDGAFQPGQTDPFQQAHQRNRGAASDLSRSVQRYLQRVLYGNRKPLLDKQGRRPRRLSDLADSPTDTEADWLFEVRFDYGELNEADPTGQPEQPWFYRPDAFSSYRAGFEVRTCRRCERVLMLHHIPDQLATPDRAAQPGYSGVVRSTEFVYDDELEPKPDTRPIYSFLKQVIQAGWKTAGGVTTRRSLPPVVFAYTQPIVQDTVEEVDATSLENLPIGLDGSSYRWIDLHGEGIPGILTEQAGAWFYKRNWSPIPTELPDGSEAVKAKFAPLETVALKPNVALSAGAEIMDLAGDGQPDVVLMEGPTPGLYEHDEAEGWQPLRPFTSRLNRDTRDPNLKFIDLDGDGHADVLVTEDAAFVWHASLAEDGFGPARRVAQVLDEEKGPRIVFADGTQSIYLADLSGDGLTDIVRIRNGEVCYWPNLGYGRFGAKVTMDNAPWFDHPDQFDHKRIRLADIDGSGTTDIIYLHRDGVRLYFNQSGNSWSQSQTLSVFPRVDGLASIVPTDLLGNGTASLVWSSPLPGDARRPMRYVNLMGGTKPHLLIKTANNLGAETVVTYTPSTTFYLRDKRAGTPWIRRLPFPVHVVESVETIDRIGGNRFVARYAYHHGHFDGEEREFRGFGMVEQWNTEQFAALSNGEQASNIAADSHVPPLHTKTWFHTGVYLGREEVSRHFEDEYFHEPGLPIEAARLLLLDDTLIPPGLTPDEEREACRALKGSMLRREVYADDADDPDATSEQIQRARKPYTVAEQSFSIRALQPCGSNRRAVFFTHAHEALTYHYERNPADPRIQHALTLEVDDFGNVLKQAAIAYGRRASPLKDWDLARQTTPLLTYTESRVTNAVEAADIHRTPLPCEAVTFELTDYAANGSAGRFRAADFVEPDPDHPGRLRLKFAAEFPYEATAAGSQCRRPIEWLRTLYARDNLAGLLPFQELEGLALPGESYKLAFTPGLLTQVFQRPRQGQADDPLLPNPAAVLAGQTGNQGGYLRSQTLKADGRFPAIDADDLLWLPSGQTPLGADAPQHFFVPRRYLDPFGHESSVAFDDFDLLMTQTRDALGNLVTVEANDYRVLQPRLVSDPNRNQTEVAFDTLGLVVGTALMGKPTDNPPLGDRIDADFEPDPDPLADPFDAFVSQPREPAPGDPRSSVPTQAAHDLLAHATTRIVYDLNRFQRLGEPPFAATIARETHVSDLKGGQKSALQISFSYSDGFGREIQKKIQAESGPVPKRDAEGKIIVGPDGQAEMTTTTASPRWVGSGWTIFNNKGKPVRQFEPYFTDRHAYESDVRVGVSPVLFYDPAERVVATLHPNHTYEKVVFDPWQQTTYDVNDTCAARPAKPDDPRPPQTGDPRTDPDIGGYVAQYFKTLPATWQTWHTQRIGGALGPDEQRAAERAAAHADTPTTAHLDTLGRPFLTVACNRVECRDHPLHGKQDEEFRTRVELDIEGNQHKVFDERKLPDADNLPLGDLQQRIVMQYAYDMLGNRIHQKSMEAGIRWMLNDVAGKPIRAWDSRGHNFITTYDALRRPVEQAVRGTTAESDPLTLNSVVLVDKIDYGESLPNGDALNLRTRAYVHFDSAGVAYNARLDVDGNPVEAYDFKGNLLRSTRRLASNYKGIPDWNNPPAAQVDTEYFEARTRYDALNRPIQSIAPHSSVTRPEHPNKFNIIQPRFNEANLLERVDVWLEQAAEPVALLDPATASPVGVANIDYDAKGQRTLIDYKNGASTTYSYDPLTFRLVQLLTKRRAADFPGDDPQPPIAGWPGKQVQNLHYTYDPAGNITHIQDDAQQAVYFRNQRVEPSNDYVYDALYRLIQADGREHLGQAGAPIPHNYNDAERVGILSANPPGRFAPNDHSAMGRYTERYVYDAVGNFVNMQHARDSEAVPNWTRRYEYAEDSLIEPGKKSNRLSTTTVGNAPAERYSHDTHGNMLGMPQLHAMQWNYRDQLQMTQRQKVNDEDSDGIKRHGEGTWYVCDASGQRVRKVTELANNGGIKDERIYLGGFEVFRSYQGAADARTLKLERETLQVMDDKRRVALVEMRTLGEEVDVAQRLIRYQFGNHLGSVISELDERAQIISYEEYAPYGGSTYQTVRSQTEAAKRYRYTGKERDEESGLYYHGARYYAAWMGRWTSYDQAGMIDGTNLYAYTKGNPISRNDPTGNDSPSVIENNIQVRTERAVRSYKDKEPPPSQPKEKLKPVHNLTAEHQGKVRSVVNWAIISAFTEARLSTSQADILTAALVKITQLRESQIPDASGNLIYRDADHYLATRIQEYPVRVAAEMNRMGVDSSEMQKLMFTPKSREKNLMASGPLGVNQLYEIRKLQEFRRATMDGQGQENSVAVGRNAPSAAGGTEWMLLGMIDWERFDVGSEARAGMPHLLIELPGSGKRFAAIPELPQYLRDEAKRIDEAIKRDGRLSK